MKRIAIIITLFSLCLWCHAQSLEAFECDSEWIDKITRIAPSKPIVTPKKQRKVLVLSLHTGFKHWVIPHTSAVLKVLSEKTGAFTVYDTKDINYFKPATLKEFDAVIFNNTCSDGKKRDLFWDKLGEDTSLSEKKRIKKASKFEKNLLKYVKKGGGFVAIHGAIVTQNNSAEFSNMLGGSFDYHPRQQEVIAELADPGHPLVEPFNGKAFVHFDEPYFFKNAYFDYNFKPLLYMDVNKLEALKQDVPDKVKYISWIKRYGKGRVFYVSPSHNAHSMEHPELLEYYLNGIQYALGDLECDDIPIGKQN